MNIYEKLFNIRQRVDSISKTGKNEYFNSSYVTLNDVLDALNPLLTEHKLYLEQPTAVSEKDGYMLIETIIRDLESEDMVRFPTELPLTKRDPQAAGSAITYGRRYALVSFFALKAEDDDGNSATFEEKANMYQVNQIKKLSKSLGKEDGVQTFITEHNYGKVEDLSKEHAQALLTRLRSIRDANVSK